MANLWKEVPARPIPGKKAHRPARRAFSHHAGSRAARASQKLPFSADKKKKKKATSLGFTPQQPPQRAARSGGPRLQRGFQGLLLQLKESACSYNKIKEINWNWMTGPPGKCDCNYRTRPPVKDTFFPFAPGWYGGFSFEPICHWKQIKKNLRQSAMFFMGF